MALPAIAGDTIYASDLYGLCQPSGGTDPGSYELAGWAAAAGDGLSVYVPSRSRLSVPVSITLGSVFDAAANINTPISVAHLDSNGVQFNQTATGASANCHYGQFFTWQY
jgi:hypothetical protein